MKILVLSDIHGNATALEAVLAAAARAGAERILNAGDLVGYYPQPGRVLSLLADWPMDCVRGNHEDMLRRARQDPAFLSACTARYGHGLSRALTDLSTDQIDWLCNLPATLCLDLDGLRLRLAHGTPQDTDAYLYPDADQESLAKAEADCSLDESLLILGHTHYQHLWTRPLRRILNPGSVGQPRDRRPGAAWALLDTATGAIDLRREAYDSLPVVTEAQRLDPDLPYLWTVLERR